MNYWSTRYIPRDPGSPSENGNGTSIPSLFEGIWTPQSSAENVTGCLGYATPIWPRPARFSAFARWSPPVKTSPFFSCGAGGKHRWGRGYYLRAQNSTRRWLQTFLEFLTPKFGEMIHFDDDLFQMGWFNHKLVKIIQKKVGYFWRSS